MYSFCEMISKEILFLLSVVAYMDMMYNSTKWFFMIDNRYHDDIEYHIKNCYKITPCFEFLKN